MSENVFRDEKYWGSCPYSMCSAFCYLCYAQPHPKVCNLFGDDYACKIAKELKGGDKDERGYDNA